MNSFPPQVQNFLSENKMATIATLSSESDYPYVLPIFYVIDDTFHLYFASNKNSKKLNNIKAHPHIGLSITDPNNLISVQLNATAAVYEQKAEIIEKILEVSNSNPNSMAPIMQIKDTEMEVISVIPSWFRYSNFSGKSPVFLEGTLDTL